MEEKEDRTLYKVVVNQEHNMYSIWPADHENPLGWHDAGKSGRKEECLEYLKGVETGRKAVSSPEEVEEDESGGVRGDL